MLKQKHWHQLVIDLLALNAKIKGCSFFYGHTEFVSGRKLR